MCSIFGYFGPASNFDEAVMEHIVAAARDRGRDGGQRQRFPLGNGNVAVLGNWRATPTTEARAAPFQPYDGIVHNGTIANDVALGNPPGAVDSMVLSRVLDRTSALGLAVSLAAVQGSYALGVVTPDRVLLAANYKPIHFARISGGTYFSSMERHFAGLLPFGLRPARVEPYTVLDLLTHGSVPLPRKAGGKALVIASAGLDSTTAAYKLKATGWDIALLHFRYGCRAETRETALVRQIGQDLGAPVVFLDIDYSPFKGRSPLLNRGERIASGLAGAEFAHEWVPARNLLMISHAVAFAEANGFEAVALGNNLEEGGAYPDNEEEFTHLLDQALDYAVADGGKVRLLAPVGRLMKHEIVALGSSLRVPFDLTWSCYEGGVAHCGHCGPCHMRRIAFERNGLQDPVFSCS